MQCYNPSRSLRTAPLDQARTTSITHYLVAHSHNMVVYKYLGCETGRMWALTVLYSLIKSLQLWGAPPIRKTKARRRRNEGKTKAKRGHSNGETGAKQKQSGGKAWQSKGIVKAKPEFEIGATFGAIFADLGQFWAHFEATLGCFVAILGKLGATWKTTAFEHLCPDLPVP